MVATMRLCVFSLDEKISRFNIGDIDLYPIFVKNKIMPELWRIYGMGNQIWKIRRKYAYRKDMVRWRQDLCLVQ